MTSEKPKTVGKLGDYYTRQTNDSILADIRGKPVVVTAAVVKERQGRRGTYQITKVTLDDGREFTVAGSIVGSAFATVPDSAFPLEATFKSEPSAFEDDAVYWTVE